MTASASWVGKAVPRKEDKRLVTGSGLFADDARAPDLLYCAILRSPHPHARVRRVDTTRAKAIPGVVAVISGEEAKAYWNPLPPNFQLSGIKAPNVYALAVDKVVYQGEPVAAVAAESRYIAEDALDAIIVEYDPLPAVSTVEEAQHGETLLYEEWGNNLQLEWPFSYGDVDAAFAQADLVLRERVATHRYGAVPLEARAILARFDHKNRELTVRLSTQAPHQCCSLIASIFNLPESKVRVLTGDVGGGYGGKAQLEVEVIPILLAILTDRPVKWTESKREWFISGPAGSRDYVHEIELALRKDGTILAVRDHLTVDLGCDGAVRSIGAGAPIVGGFYLPGPYKVSNYSIIIHGFVTNKAPYGAYRGYGKDIANFAIERMLDLAARQLELDPFEIRRRNLIDNFPYEMCSGPVIENGSFLECLQLLAEAMNLSELKRLQQEARREGRYTGIGMVSMLEPSAGSIPMSIFSGFESATVRLNPDGTATLFTGIQPIGQGIETAYAQVVADQLGLTPDDITVIYGDTTAVPYGLGAYASRGATFGVSAAYEAANKVRVKLLKAAGNLLEASSEDLELANGEIWVRGASEKKLSIREVVKAVYFFPGPYALLLGEPDPVLQATAVYTSPAVKWQPDEYGRVRIYPTHGSGAIGASVEVDLETGQVQVKKIWFVHDSGRIINPQIVEAQLIGGTIQAFGGAMFEQLKYDDQAHMLTQTLTDYQIPNSASVPIIQVLHRETPSPITPLGTKGLGEGGHIGVVPAIMAAVEDALAPFGVKVLETPLTPQRVLEMIDKAPRTTHVS